MLVNWCVRKGNDQCLQSPNILKNDQRYWFFKHWPERDINVEVIDYSKLPLIHTIERDLLRFYMVQTLKVSHQLHRFDLIISHGAQSGIFLAFMRSIFGIKHPPHIIIDVGCLNGGRSRQPELSLFQFAARSISCVIYHVSGQREHYEKYFPFLLDKAFYVPFGVDPDFFMPVNVKPQNYILAMGYKFRDWENLIRAFKDIGKDIKLRIVGPKRLDAGIESFPPNISHQPYVPITILKDLMAKAKIIVVPLVDIPYAHGQMTLLQSMAMGKAVVVTKVPATVDYVINGENGLLVNLYDAEDMRYKIEFLLNNPQEITRLGRNARKSVEEKFSEKRMGEGIYRAINQLKLLKNE
jgi:glycosyltransferase involved in cell wall biosynthesis